MSKLTNIRTYLQFSQYNEVKAIVYNGNKLMAMNAIKSVYGVKQFSVIKEYKADGFLQTGVYSDSAIQ